MTRILSDQLALDMEQFVQALTKTKLAQPNLSIGIKNSWQNFAGTNEQLLFYLHINWLNGDIQETNNGMLLRLEELKAIAINPDFELKNLQKGISTCLLESTSGWVNKDIFWHAIIPVTYTCFVQPLSFLAMSLIEIGGTILRNKFQSNFNILPDQATPTQYRDSVSQIQADGKMGILFENSGFLICAESLSICLDNLTYITKQLESMVLIPTNIIGQDSEHLSGNYWGNLPELRRTLSNKLKHPVILQLDQNQISQEIFKNKQILMLINESLPLASLSIRSNIKFINTTYSNTAQFTSELANGQGVESPSVVLLPKCDPLMIGTSIKEIGFTKEVFQSLGSMIAAAKEKGELIVTSQLKQDWECIPILINAPPPLPFTGEISLVTGAASGIGKACVESLLSRGAIVVGLDINPDIFKTFDHENYLGLVCDISNINEVKKSIKTIIQTFGGLDILILNAGIFPKGCNICSIQIDEFNKVLNVNLTSNLVLLRETYPLLKYASRHGRVVIVGSKNIKAPGPGAVAYSTSKAGLVQMARVAALEWASDGIRINIIHPDSVFDTGLYTEDVLKARADFYNMPIEDYKKRNLLKTEITSQTIGEMVAEMCGNLFKTTTGAQIQVDGGNDRTI